MIHLRTQYDKLDLAESANDSVVLVSLCQDVSSDVRCAVARNDNLSFEQLVALYHDEDSMVSSTALSSLAKVPMNDVQSAEYQEILRDIANDTASDCSLLREVVYNATDQAVLAALYLRCENSHIRSGIVRHIQVPDILEAEIADIILRKAGERRVDNILCNPTLTAEQLLPLIKARKLNPVDILRRVESADALLGVARACHLTTIPQEYGVLADLNADQLETLLDIDERYQSLVHDQLHKLGIERCRALPGNNRRFG